MVEKVKFGELQRAKQKQQLRQNNNYSSASSDCSGTALISVKKLMQKGSKSGCIIALIIATILLTSDLVDGASLNKSLVDENDHDLVKGLSTSLPTQSNTTQFPPNETEDEKTTHKRTIENKAILNEIHHINFTLPIHDFERQPIIVKHGNIFYEVVDNGTISTNMGAFTIPIIATPIPAFGVGIYEQMTATVVGLRVEESAKGVSYSNGASKILANSPALIRFFGRGFTNNTIVRFVMEEGERGSDCDDVASTAPFQFDSSQWSENSAVVKVTIPPLNEEEKLFYVCVKENDTDMPWIHQGGEPWILLTSYEKWLPLWAHIIILVFLLALSGLFSGLNLGLMAIDRTELKIIINAGSEKEKRNARQIQPIRNRGNYLLCSLLLGNVLVNASLTILLDDISSGLIAVVGSTVGIVIFGEIVPQAVCSRHGLSVGARTVWITKFFMAVTFPLSYPISVILDKVLGEEIGNVYNRERLKELILVTQGDNDLEKQEVNIISGALDLKQKTVADVMTRLEEVYMLPIDALLDFETVTEIMKNGYSRIPVYENQKGNVVSLLYTKDLAFVDPDDKMPLRAVCEFYSNPCHFVFENVTLNVLFNVFKQGKKGHMAFVQRVKLSDKADPTYEVVGLVTLEDVIEELIREEIYDETDVLEIANKANPDAKYIAFNSPLTRLKTEGTTVSPQLTFAAFQYLSTAVEEFNDSRISKTVLERLLKQNIYFHLKIKDKEKTDPSTILYERGKPADYFVMILEGKVNVEVGKEGLLFEGGPFSFFGTSSLCPPLGDGTVPATPLAIRKISQTSFDSAILQPGFISEYTVRAVTDLTYFQISRSMYQAAKQATSLEKAYNPADNFSEGKNEEDIERNLEDVDKPKDKPLTVGKPGRGSISEVIGGRRQVTRHLSHELFKDKHHESLITDNNNVSMTKFDDISERDNGMSQKDSNMARVIIYPKDEKPNSESRLQRQTSFIPGAIGEEEEEDKGSCKL